MDDERLISISLCAFALGLIACIVACLALA
jgi:hypothetical protein